MTIISKNTEIQENLMGMYDLLVSEKNKVQEELSFSRMAYEMTCELHIQSNFLHEKAWLSADKRHQDKFMEYDLYCHIIEIINDFKDIHGHFPDYTEMYLTLHQIMLRLAEEEQYEIAAIAKVWVDKIRNIIISCPSYYKYAKQIHNSLH